MTIREIELQAGLDRTNIRFYEREGLLEPSRLENGYRDYSKDDLVLLKKIKLLRRLGFSIVSIRALKDGDAAMDEALSERLSQIHEEKQELAAAETVCHEMQQDKVEFSNLNAEYYLRSFDRALIPETKSKIPATVPQWDKVEVEPAPIRRFFARMLDLTLVHIAILTTVLLIFRVNVTRINVAIQLLLGFVDWGVLILVEGLLLSRFGTTLGKLIMGISLEHEDGRRLTFKEAAGRAVRVFVRGCGCGIPIANIVRYIKSWIALSEDGELPWDENVERHVKDEALWRIGVYVGVFVVSLALGVTLALTPSMPEHRGAELTAEQFAENYNQMQIFYGINTGLLQPDGTFYELPGTVVWGDEPEPIVMQFTEQDGELTGIYFEEYYTSPFVSTYLPASRFQSVAMLTTLAYGFSDAGLFQRQNALKTLEAMLSTEEGVWQRDLFGCRIVYTITSLGIAKDENNVLQGENYYITFSIERLK